METVGCWSKIIVFSRQCNGGGAAGLCWPLVNHHLYHLEAYSPAAAPAQPSSPGDGDSVQGRATGGSIWVFVKDVEDGFPTIFFTILIFHGFKDDVCSNRSW